MEHYGTCCSSILQLPFKLTSPFGFVQGKCDYLSSVLSLAGELLPDLPSDYAHHASA